MAQNPSDIPAKRGEGEIRREITQGATYAVSAQRREPDADLGMAALLQELLKEIREIRTRMNILEDSISFDHTHSYEQRRVYHDYTSDVLDVTYGRTQEDFIEMIKHQGLQNFQIGLSDEIKLIVRTQNYKILQEAIASATAEEKVKGTSPSTPKCLKCDRTGHYARDCRSRFPLPKPERNPRINAINKYCKYCKKTGPSRNESSRSDLPSSH
ncbi:hypothetical protein ALC60_11715 [Trachymyrmex zeteki]|nr:hypothetical protein ALC60_11715 [Trachymyrmex zeteki]